MNPINISLDNFLHPFFESKESVCIRIFDDRKDSAFKGAKLECEAGKINAITDKLNQHNAQNRGIYFVVNYGGHNDGRLAVSMRYSLKTTAFPSKNNWSGWRALPFRRL